MNQYGQPQPVGHTRRTKVVGTVTLVLGWVVAALLLLLGVGDLVAYEYISIRFIVGIVLLVIEIGLTIVLHLQGRTVCSSRDKKVRGGGYAAPSFQPQQQPQQFGVPHIVGSGPPAASYGDAHGMKTYPQQTTTPYYPSAGGNAYHGSGQTYQQDGVLSH